MNTKIKNLIKFTIGIIILFTLIYKIGILDIFNAIKTANIYYTIPIIIIYPIIMLMGAINIKLLLNKYKNISIKTIWKYQLISYTLGLFSFGNLGEFYIIRLLKKEGISIDQGLTIALLDKIITAATLATISIIGSIFLFKNIIDPIKLVISAIIIFILGIIIISDIGKKLIKLIIKSKKVDLIYSTTHEYLKYGKKEIIINFLISMAKWFITAIGIKILILGFGYNINILIVLVITSISRFISLLPITFNGIGVKEAIAVTLYTPYLIPREVILSVYLIYLIINYATALIGLLIGALNFKKID